MIDPSTIDTLRFLLVACTEVDFNFCLADCQSTCTVLLCFSSRIEGVESSLARAATATSLSSFKISSSALQALVS